MTTITRETWERMGQDRALADALDPQPGAPEDWTVNDLARFFADGAQAAEKQAAEQVADLRHRLQDMERERDVSRGNAQMHMLAAQEMAVQLEAAQKGLRDEFAGQALQGMLANPQADLDAHQDAFARASYVMAEAMLKARGVKAA